MSYTGSWEPLVVCLFEWVFLFVCFFNQPHHSCTLLFQDEETGMCVGMLPNGDTGVYHKSYVDDSVNEQHSVV